VSNCASLSQCTLDAHNWSLRGQIHEDARGRGRSCFITKHTDTSTAPVSYLAPLLALCQELALEVGRRGVRRRQLGLRAIGLFPRALELALKAVLLCLFVGMNKQ